MSRDAKWNGMQAQESMAAVGPSRPARSRSGLRHNGEIPSRLAYLLANERSSSIAEVSEQLQESPQLPVEACLIACCLTQTHSHA